MSVNCRYPSYAAHAVFFPIPRKDDVVSQSVKLWNRGRAKDFRGPSCLATAWTGIICASKLCRSRVEKRGVQTAQTGTLQLCIVDGQ